MSEKFCGSFRQKFIEDPGIIYKISKRLVSHELSIYRNNEKKTDNLYLWICKKYFGFDNMEIMIRWLQTYPEIQKITFLWRLAEVLKSHNIGINLEETLAKDKNHILALIS